MYEDGFSISQDRALGARLFGLGVIVLLAVLWSGLVLAQAQESPENFLNGLAQLDSSYLPAGSGNTGEAVDRYTGSLGFVVTDVSLPGNSDLSVSVTRRFSVESPGINDEHYAFEDWQLEVPVISGVVSGQSNTTTPSSGWRYLTGTGANAFDRCSHFGQMPNISVTNPSNEFRPTEYWGGFHLKVPGAGSQMLLSRATGNTHTPSASIELHNTFPVVTKNDWVAACLSSLDNSEPGEGFLVVAPDGRKFWFDWLVYRTMATLYKPGDAHAFSARDQDDGTDSPQAGSTARLPRLRALLYASRVEDRFGHWVTYTYGGTNHDQLTDIEADDGRHIVIHWSGGVIDKVTAQPQLATDSDPLTNPSVWQYGYNGTTTSLTDVTRPDGAAWGYDLFTLSHAGRSLGGARCKLNDNANASAGSGGGTIDGSVTTPGGLAVDYKLIDTARGHADSPDTCLYAHSIDDPGQPAYAETYFVWALDTRTESGAGFADRSWNYDYSDPNGSWSYECNSGCPHDTVWTKVTDQEGRAVKSTYSNVYDATEGQLQRTDWYDPASLGGLTLVRSQVKAYADPDTGPWPESYGYPSNLGGQTRSNEANDGTRTPLETRTTSEGGTNYTWSASTWNGYAEPTDIIRSSSGTSGDSVSETMAYNQNTALWVLGQFASRTITAPMDDAGAVPESRSYHASDATPDTISRFGHTVATYTWYPSGGGADGKLASVKDGNLHTTSYSNYAYGVPTTVTYADGKSISLTSNAFGEVLDVTDELYHKTSVLRDDMGRITHKTFPGGDSTTWGPVNIAYDQIASTEYGVGGAHWRVTRTQGRNKQVTVYNAALNPVLGYAMDTSPGSDAGHMTWHQYDSSGHATFVSYPLDYGSTLPSLKPGVATDYDVLGRATETRANSELGLLTTTIDYLTGNQRTVTDPRNHSTTTTYQAFDHPAYDQPVKVTFESGITTTVTRDSFGAPTEMKQDGTYASNPISVTHSFGYDTNHRLCKQISPETGQTAYDYDNADNLHWTAEGLNDANPTQCNTAPSSSAKIIRSYDNRDRLIKINYPSGTPDKHFTYYADGQPWTATRDASTNGPASTWTMTYYNRGMLEDETLAIEGHNFKLAYGYDSEGNGSTIQYPSPSNRQVDFAPDGLGRPTQAGVFASNLDYASQNAIKSFDYGNGVGAVYGYNTRDLLDTTTYTRGSAPLTDRSLTYDENANLKTITDTAGCGGSDVIFCDGFDGAVGTDAQEFTYDVLDRLTNLHSARYGDDHYSYDPLGNVRTATSVGTYNYDATHNRISNINNATSYGHDTRGNITSIGTDPINWNRANEQSSDYFGTTYGYDARGWRVKRVVQAGHTADGITHTRYFVYNSQHRLMTRLDNGVQTDFVYLGTTPIARIEGSTTTWIQGNYQHSPLFETNSAGSITRAPDYLGYGRTDVEGQKEIPGYTGAAPDRETGQVYLGARYLFRQRFTSPDPVGLNPTSPTGLNRYAYAANNPVRFTDPFGACVGKSDPECNPKPTRPQPLPKPEVSRTVQRLRNASDCSVLQSCTHRIVTVGKKQMAVKQAASRANNPHLKRNILIGTGAVGVIGAIGLNIIGFPEVEVGEGAAVIGFASVGGIEGATALEFMDALAAEPYVSRAVILFSGFSIGAVPGGAVGYALTRRVPPQPSCTPQSKSTGCQ